MKYLKSLLILFFIFFLFPCCTYSSTEKTTVTTILLDVSASMDTIEPSGHSRFDIALEKINEILEQYHNFDYIGLRTIGMAQDRLLSKVYDNPSSFGNSFLDIFNNICNATEEVVPISDQSHYKIKSYFKKLAPTGGSTPIEYTLKQTINVDFEKFPRYIKKRIIIITDGSESCKANPCQYIRNLSKERDDIIIDVISVLDDNSNFKLYNCLTSATGGNIYDAKKDVKLKKINAQPIKTKQIYSDNSKNIIYKHYLLEFN